MVRWTSPPLEQRKCNTDDGASKGNYDPRSINFYVRNFYGDITGAKGERIHNTSNVMAEARVFIMESNSLSMVNILNEVS